VNTVKLTMIINGPGADVKEMPTPPALGEVVGEGRWERVRAAEGAPGGATREELTPGWTSWVTAGPLAAALRRDSCVLPTPLAHAARQ